jgi:precorrin-2 dehydrogenase / sirohydrochlorin ferrochelatase
MIAVALDPAAVAIAVAGRGPPALRRLSVLRAGGAHPLFFCDFPGSEFLDGLDDALRERLPSESDLAGLGALWIAGLPREEAATLAARARARRVLVNVEDVRPLCDFHNVAEVRRGDLLLTVSTGGRSPGLAARIRARLAGQFGQEWAERLAVLDARRSGWRADGRSTAEVARLTDDALSRAGWSI